MRRGRLLTPPVSYDAVGVVSLLIPSHLHHHDGAVGAHADVEAGGEVAVVLVEDGAHGGVLAGDGYSQDGVVRLDGLGGGVVSVDVSVDAPLHSRLAASGGISAFYGRLWR